MNISGNEVSGLASPDKMFNIVGIIILLGFVVFVGFALYNAFN